MSKTLNKALLIAAMTTAVAGYTAAASAEDKPASEKCFGVSKAGKNDCKGGGVATCAGHAAKDGEGFVTVPKGVCEKLAGGTVGEKK